MLDWEVNSDGVLIAAHPVNQLWEYEVQRSGEAWVAEICDSLLFNGSLEQCLAACRRDAREARRQRRIKELRREVNRLERSDGGNWRRLKRMVQKREQLQRLERVIK